MATRAVRNNNPGNLNRGEHWQGLMPVLKMTSEQRSEPRFAVFLTPAWGFRAMCIIIRNYSHLYGIHTIGGVIDRWAPPSENNTIAYKKAVVDEINADHLPGLAVINDTTPVDFNSHKVMVALCRAIAVHESGSFLFQNADLESGVKMVVGT